MHLLNRTAILARAEWMEATLSFDPAQSWKSEKSTYQFDFLCLHQETVKLVFS